MADDIYSALIGASPSSAEKQATIANALRRQNMLGQIGQLTGDRTIAPVGQGMVQQAGQFAQQLQGGRQFDREAAQRDRSQDQTQFYQEGQLGHMRDSLEETKRSNTLQHIYQMMMAQAAQEKAEKTGTGSGKIPRLRQGDIKELQDLGQTIGTVQGLEKFLEEGGKFGAVEVNGMPLPGARGLSNTMASMGFGDESMKATFNAHQNWNRLYNLAERNRMFGATLTPNEQRSWKSANPSGNMTDAQIKEALPIMRKVFEHRMQRKVAGLSKEGYSPEAMAEYADIPGINLPTEMRGDPAQQMQPVTPADLTNPQTKRLKMLPDGTIVNGN